jgi:hypothetical protein
MIHVRVVSPPEVTAALTPLLDSDAAVLNLTVLEAAVQNPDGDAVQFDVLQGRTNEVMARLRELGVDQRGSITLQPLAASISASATRARAGRPRFDEFAPVW